MSLKISAVPLLSITIFFSSISIAYSADSMQIADIVSDCDSGLTKACIDVGVAYTMGELKGKKIKKDKAKAKHYISKAVKRGQQNCQQGDSLDCYTLGLLFFEGGGLVPTNIPRGLELLQRSCNGGYKKACSWLDNSGLGNIR